VIKIAPQGNEVSSRGSSLDDELIIVPDKQASREGLQNQQESPLGILTGHSDPPHP